MPLKPPAGTPRIDGFLKGVRPNVWLQGRKMEVYVRKATHVLSDLKAYSCFDIANISVHPEFQNQGVFTAWLAYVEAELKGNQTVDFIYVESILNPHLPDALTRRGYQRKTIDLCINMYKAVAR